ncbi:methyltransferase domain-containing protein [Jannaschia sp. W003]|uniref:methyltransferase domain-containing protein n=1 Tax=Jannaschia sp. W003 TaxID=2867012 RepID=UPI0021A28A9F|nr:methyltransferase domain-containing protein [Jannaschia sp. W003]UWQ21958.1 methyltransferase domain-containing protein [Jannaschia sp. W003]
MLTDRAALEAHRVRALGRMGRPGDGGAWFAHSDAVDELHERLKDVNRTFTAPAIVTGFPALFGSLVPGARVVADTDVLALEPGAHDLVVHFMCLHWADDPVGQLVQCRRALRPDGLLLACCFGGESLGELRAAMAQAEIEVAGGLSPRVAPMGEVRDLGALLGRAGLALPVADVDTRTVRYGAFEGLVRDLRETGETNALAARHRAAPPRALFARAADIYREAFPDGDGLRATVQTVWLAGWAPAEGQQKPLRPGSAAMRLADALGTEEMRPGDPARPAAKETE